MKIIAHPIPKSFSICLSMFLILALIFMDVSCTVYRNPDEPYPVKINMEMVLIPTGKFLMGINSNDIDQRPLHDVYLDAYWIDLTEVTNAHYLTCVDDGGCRPPGESQYYRDESLSDHPVVYVTWFDARDFCAWAGKRLPTETEWEKAARGTDGRLFPWGSEPADERLANYDDNIHKTTPVGSYPAGASPYGLQDMAGNVWEWVNDWYSMDYYRTSIRKNPQGPESGDRKVLRGGSWFSIVDIVLKTHIRKKRAPDIRDYGTGFRCAFSAD